MFFDKLIINSFLITFRAFIMKKYVPCKTTKNQRKPIPVTYVISKDFTYQMISVSFAFMCIFTHCIYKCSITVRML